MFPAKGQLCGTERTRQLCAPSRAASGRGAAIRDRLYCALCRPNPQKIKALRLQQPNRRAVGAARRCAAAFGLDSALGQNQLWARSGHRVPSVRWPTQAGLPVLSVPLSRSGRTRHVWVSVLRGTCRHGNGNPGHDGRVTRAQSLKDACQESRNLRILARRRYHYRLLFSDLGYSQFDLALTEPGCRTFAGNGFTGDDTWPLAL